MKLYRESDLIDLVQSLKDYTRESGTVLGYDEREPEEFVDIFLKDRTAIELPTNEEMGKLLSFHAEGAKWVIEQIKQQVDGTNTK